MAMDVRGSQPPGHSPRLQVSLAEDTAAQQSDHVSLPWDMGLAGKAFVQGKGGCGTHLGAAGWPMVGTPGLDGTPETSWVPMDQGEADPSSPQSPAEPQ